MRSAKNYLIAFLSLTTLGSGYYAWQQSRELAALRESAASPSDQSTLRKRVWDAEKRAQALERDLAATPAAPGNPAADSVTTPAAQRPRRGDAGATFAKLMENQDYQRLLSLQQKGMLDGRYAALFKNLHLTPKQLDDFKRLLVEKQSSMIDVLAAARSEGFDPRSDPAAFRQLVTTTQNEVDESIKATLGDTAFSEYKNYETTLPYRNVVEQLDARLSYSATPLTDAQSQQMLQILATTTPPRPADAPPMAATAMRVAGLGSTNALNFMGGGTRISDEAVTRSQSVLSTDQVAALQQIQQEQQAQAQLGQIMRSQFGGGARPGTTVVPAR
ncbi:MAG: hypothetical protein KA257_10665 [Opitutaceae bacterium]|nr:hypothetical protein [Opitutaceae bacterium]MBP9912984.1 hypothetical protein [Opitutaceae bacterium]